MPSPAQMAHASMASSSWPLFTATRLSYDVASGRWRETQNCKVQIATSAFARGGMRLAFRGLEHETAGALSPCVLKFFEEEQLKHPKYYFAEASTQMVAESIAQEFNKALKRNESAFRAASRGSSTLPTIGFVPVSVLRFNDKSVFGQRFCTIEPLLDGQYRKHTDNDGMSDNEPAAVAFEHFSHFHTAGSLVVCDLQGVSGTLFTDPQIHSLDGRGFGLGNLGNAGIQRWRAKHKCTSLCHVVCAARRTPSSSRGAASAPPRMQPPPPPPPRRRPAAGAHGLMRVAQPGESDAEVAARLQAEEYSVDDENGAMHFKETRRRFDGFLDSAARWAA